MACDTGLCKHLKVNESDFCHPYALCRASSYCRRAARAARCPQNGAIPSMVLRELAGGGWRPPHDA